MHCSSVILLLCSVIVSLASGLEKSDVRTVKLVRIARLTKLLKLLRYTRLKRITATLTRRTMILNRALMRLCKLLFSIVFMAHLLSCLWGFVAHTPIVMEASGFTPTWLEPFPGYRVVAEESPLPLYIASTYYVVSTMLAVG